MRRRTGTAVLLVIAVAVAATLRLFVWPASDDPSPADAVFVLGGDGERIERGIGLVRDGYAPVLVLSKEPTDVAGCPATIAGAEVVCFAPEPFSTRGEGRFLGRLAAERGWRHVMVVTTPAQATRAHIRMGRCWGGRLDVVTAELATGRWAADTAYEWGAVTRAVAVERDC
jgi:hypothetical protein